MIDINSLISGFHLSPVMALGSRIAVVTVLAWVAIAFSHRLIRSLRIAYSNTLDNSEDVKRITTVPVNVMLGT